MVDFSLRRTTQFGLALLGIALIAGSATNARAVLLAYEGFSYPADSLLFANGAGLNGGTGWDGAWDNDTMVVDGSTKVLAGSLSYTDSLGNVLNTSGGKLNNTVGAEGAANQQGRNLSVRRESTGTMISTWVSLLGIRQGTPDAGLAGLQANTFGRGANFVLFDTEVPITTQQEKISVGENSGSYYPYVDGNDLLRIQRGEVSTPATMDEQFALFKASFGGSGTLATKAEDRWMTTTPRVNSGITAMANPALTFNGAPITQAIEFQRNPIQGSFQRLYSQTAFAGQTSLLVMRIDHMPGGEAARDKALIWMNPDLDAMPADSEAEIVIDMAEIEARATDINNAGGTIVPFDGPQGALLSFDRVRLFAGAVNGQNGITDWLLDEIRFGEAFGDVTPHSAPAVSAVPEPGTLILAAAALVAVRGLRRRKS
jgi:hypothetical protein